jgi:hypothetical protein
MQEYKTQFELDWNKPMNINGMESNKGYYNLVVTIRDLKLFSRGMKPHRFWRLKDVKHYFGIKGNTKTILKRLEDFRDGNL